MRPKRRGLPLTLDTVTESTLVLNISSTAALICGLVAWSATRNTYWRFLSATKVLFSDTTGASTTLIRLSALYFLVAVISASPRASPARPSSGARWESAPAPPDWHGARSEEHTSELQSPMYLV